MHLRSRSRTREELAVTNAEGDLVGTAVKRDTCD